MARICVSGRARVNVGESIVEGENLVTSAAAELVAKILAGEESDALKYIAVGSGCTEPSLSDVALENEIARKQASIARSGGKIELSVSFTFANSTSICEAGVITSNEVLVSRFLIGSHNIGPTTTVTINWELNINSC